MFDHDLATFVAEHTATSQDGDHLLVVSDYPHFIRMEGSLRSVQQASGRLQLGDWSSAVATCSDPHCLRPDHLDEHTTVLVQAAARPSLSQLYDRARQRGLVQPQTAYA